MRPSTVLFTIAIEQSITQKPLERFHGVLGRQVLQLGPSASASTASTASTIYPGYGALNYQSIISQNKSN
jgi:hypothetical protein